MIDFLPQAIIYHAEKTPQQPAFRFLDQCLTYRQLSHKIQQLAGCLIESGIRKGDRVGIFLNRSLETAIAIHGILLSGAVYVPLNPKAPAARNHFVIEDCGITTLVTNSSQKRLLQPVVAQATKLRLVIGTKIEGNLTSVDWESIYKRSPDQASMPTLSPTDLAYIIYTSGSTGNPKGIMHTHASGLAYARLTAKTYGLKSSDIIANHAPIFFDISTLGYFTAPYVGACTVILSDAHTILPSSLSQLIERESITVWYSIPLVLIQLLQQGLLSKDQGQSIRWVLYGGEPFPPKYLRQLMQHWPRAKVSNIYGPTETNQCTFHNITTPPVSNTPIPLGQVWEETQYTIIDTEDQILNGAGTGELLIHSSTMMKGYWGNPELTERSFYEHHGKIYYRTGDLVERDSGEVLHFKGRKDHQVKIRGYRVELGEIESILVQHNSVREAAVVLVQYPEEVRLEAAVILVQKETEASLLAYLREQVPLYAVPQKIHIKENFPRTGSGKINRPKIIEALTQKPV